MNKFIPTAVIASVLCCSASTFAASNGEGQINFTGEIMDASCDVVNGVDAPLDVTLGKVSKDAFTGTGSTAASTRFSIELTNCPDTVTAASITFGGTPSTDNSNVLGLTQDANVASGVGVQLLDASGSPVDLFTPSESYTLQSGTAVNDLGFIARYIQTSDTLTPGTANAVSTFTVVYN